MATDRWEEVKRLFQKALEREPSRRSDFLDGLEALNPSLRKKVDSLLVSYDHDGSFLEKPHLDEMAPSSEDPDEDSDTQIRVKDPVEEKRKSPSDGDRIGEYRILREIGHGGMGVVYEAEQQHPRRSVALKVIRGERYVDEYHVRLFQREAQALARLKHSGIASIYETGRTEDGQHFFAMELVTGEPLSDYLNNRPKDASWKNELRFRLKLFVKMCEAVNYAHQRGVIHRDLKPSNILVSEEAESGSGSTLNASPQIKILDFGLARITDPDAADISSMTAMGRIQGTLPYMSPEQAKGIPENIDIRTDVYSLGVILYEMVTGQKPYELQPSAPLEALRIICHEMPKNPKQALRQAGRQLDSDLETILLKALAKDSAERYQSVAGLSEDVGNYLVHRPILAHPPSTMYQLKKLVYRHKVGFGFLAALSLLVLGFAVVTTVQSARIAQERDRAERRRAQAEDLIGFMLGDLRAKLEPLGQLDILDDVGDEALDYFAAVTEADMTDEELFRRSTALIQIGQVRRSLGDLSAAKTAFEESLSLAKAMVARNPENKDWQAGLGKAHYELGYALLDEGDIDGCLAHYQAHLRIAETLVAENPDSLKLQRDLAFAYSKVADATYERGNLNQALDDLEKSRQIMTAIIEKEPANQDWQLELGEVNGLIGSVMEDSGRLGEAEKYYRAALEINEHLVQEAPGNKSLLERLSTIHHFVAGLLEKIGDLDGALRHFESAVEISKELVAHDPSNLSWKRDLAASQIRTGRTHNDLGRRDDALPYLEDALETMQTLTEQDPDNIDWRLILAIAYLDLGRLDLARGEAERAQEHARMAQSHFESYSSEDPENLQSKYWLSQTQVLLGHIHARQGQSVVARECWERARKEIEPLALETSETNTLAVWATVLLLLDRIDEAVTVVEIVKNTGYKHPDFMKLCRDKGLTDTGGIH